MTKFQDYFRWTVFILMLGLSIDLFMRGQYLFFLLPMLIGSIINFLVYRKKLLFNQLFWINKSITKFSNLWFVVYCLTYLGIFIYIFDMANRGELRAFDTVMIATHAIGGYQIFFNQNVHQPSKSV